MFAVNPVMVYDGVAGDSKYPGGEGGFLRVQPVKFSESLRENRSRQVPRHVFIPDAEGDVTVNFWHKLFVEFRKRFPIVRGNLLFVLARADIKHLRL